MEFHPFSSKLGQEHPFYNLIMHHTNDISLDHVPVLFHVNQQQLTKGMCAMPNPSEELHEAIEGVLKASDLKLLGEKMQAFRGVLPAVHQCPHV